MAGHRGFLFGQIPRSADGQPFLQIVDPSCEPLNGRKTLTEFVDWIAPRPACYDDGKRKARVDRTASILELAAGDGWMDRFADL